jgi:hypothetical protein
MSTIADKLRTILGIKTEIKQAIIDKGGTLDDSTPFTDYPEQILAIKSGEGKLNRKELMRRIYIMSR